MNRFFTGLAGLFRRGGLDNPDEGMQSAGSRALDSDDQLDVEDDRAMSISAVWGCARLITQSMATMPLGVYEKDADGDRKPVSTDHYLRRLLTSKPNPSMNAKELRTALTLQRVLWGNAFAAITRDALGRPVALRPVNPAAVRIERRGDDLEFVYTTSTGRPTTWYNRGGELPQVFHWRGLTIDGFTGLSPLAYARHALGLSVATDRQAMKAFTGRPMGVMQSDREYTQDQAVQLRKLYDRIGSSAVSDGKWWLIPPGFKYSPIGIPPDDLQMLDSRKFQVSEICRFYGVPGALMDAGGESSANWPSSYEQQQLQFLTFTLKAYLEEFEEKVSEALVLPKDRNVYAEHNVEGFLRTDSGARANYYSTMVQNGIMTRNEVRRKENLQPLDGLDEATIQLNLAPAGQLGEINGA